MNKQDLAKRISRETFGLTRKEVYAVIDYAFSLLGEALIEGQEGRIEGFGTFKAIRRKAYTTQHPKTRQPVHVPSQARIRFRLSRHLKERLLQQGVDQE